MTFATFERIVTSAHIVILAVLGLVAIVGVCLGAWHQLLVAARPRKEVPNEDLYAKLGT